MTTHAEALRNLAEWVEENPIPDDWCIGVDLITYGYPEKNDQIMNIHTHGELQRGKDLFPGVDWDETYVRNDGKTSYVTGVESYLGFREITVFN